MSRNEKFWVDQVMVPPPPEERQGVGKDKGGGVHEDDVTHLMASGHAAVQLMHKTPSLWRRANMPWIFWKCQTNTEPASLPVRTLVRPC